MLERELEKTLQKLSEFLMHRVELKGTLREEWRSPLMASS
jgi:hypothetical protein